MRRLAMIITASVCVQLVVGIATPGVFRGTVCGLAAYWATLIILILLAPRETAR